MESTFTGFSEEDLIKIKSGEPENAKDSRKNISNFKKVEKIGAKPRKVANQYKLPTLKRLYSDDAAESFEFDKCKLSIRNLTVPPEVVINDGDTENEDSNQDKRLEINAEDDNKMVNNSIENNNHVDVGSRKTSTSVAPDIIRSVDNHPEDEAAAHVVKIGELQLKQKLMEEQNKKRKEMLAKALADRTKQTEEEVMRLEKIKRELHILDGQFSQDVSVLRKKIDLACLSYADAEKHYLRIEKEFLQAKINLQKEKEKKELLTEHLCALITHNEMRKAKKLETLMLELASDRKVHLKESPPQVDNETTIIHSKESPAAVDDETAVIVDGVDERTGKIVEISKK